MAERLTLRLFLLTLATSAGFVLLAGCGGGGGGSSPLPPATRAFVTPSAAPSGSPQPTTHATATPMPSSPTPTPYPTSTPATTGFSGPNAVLSAGNGNLMDAQTARMQWVTQQFSAGALTGPYLDFYISSLREVGAPGGVQPDWQTVNTHEDAFLHSADPASLTLQPQSGALTVHWNSDGRASLGLIISGYAVYLGTSPNSMTQIATLPSSATSYTASGLNGGSTYYVAVHALLNGVDSAYSWTESAIAAAPASTVLDSPSFSVSGNVSPGATVTLTVRAHASGPSLPSSLQLQTLVQPSGPAAVPAVVTMTDIGGGVYQGAATVAIPAGYYGGVAFRVADANGAVLLPQSGTYYTTAPNNRLHLGVYPNNYVMDASSTSWQQLLTAYIASKVPQGYNGVLLDDTGGSLIGDRTEAFPPNYSDSAYLAARESEMAAIRAGVPSNYALCLNGFDTPALVAAYLPYAQRGEIEEVAYDMNSWGYAPLWYWKSSANNVLTVTGQDNVPSRMLVDAPETDTAARTYILATYLLLQSSNLYYDLETNAGLGYYFPEYTVSLGAPAQTFADISQAYVAADGAYERTFAHGKVFINPGNATTPVISLNGTYNEIRLTGGAVEHGGSLSMVPVTQLQLGPDQAAVLMH